jgi:DNA polymerase-3 subunit delta'
MSGAIEPRANPDLVGQAGAEAALRDAARGGRLAHAWLISGPAGIGKATLAYRFARWLLAGASGESLALDPAHPTFRRVAAGTHADLLTVERGFDEKRKRERAEIVVDDVRRVADFLRRTPAEGGWRVVVLDGAETLNRNAANALLKVLEEPPARAMLLLTCAAPGLLLPTIRSRCRALRLQPLDDAAMAALLASLLAEPSPERRERLAALAEGSPGRALLLAEADGVALDALVQEVLATPTLSLTRAHEVADALGRGEAGFTTFMQLLRAALALAVRQAARGQADAAQRRLLGGRPLAAWSDVWQALGQLQDATEHAHLDQRQAVVSGLSLLGIP